MPSLWRVTAAPLSAHAASGSSLSVVGAHVVVNDCARRGQAGVVHPQQRAAAPVAMIGRRFKYAGSLPASKLWLDS